MNVIKTRGYQLFPVLDGTQIDTAKRFASGQNENSNEVTVIKDATADYSDEEMHAALDVNIPNYASAIASTEEIVASIATL